jgi:Ni2+-binding GTPase involved in maturation of urease and hydrogenase
MIGGFLGAGKTTLMAQAAQRLAAAGKRVGLITNDQATDLVDTELLRGTDAGVREVSGGCFCCGFNRLLHACDELIEQFSPDILLGEPVGSCADLSATVIQPIKRYCADRLQIGPFTVLAEPPRLAEALAAADDPADDGGVRYIFWKQLEEADRIVLSKADLLTEPRREKLKQLLARRFDGREVMEVSAATGAGLDAWLQYITSDAAAGRRVVEIDYDTYAAGEAALGWLNALIRLRWSGGADWPAYCLALLEQIRRRCRTADAMIGHVKLLLRANGGTVSANLTDVETPPTIDGAMEADTDAVSLILNARVATTPSDLREWVTESLAAAMDGEVTAEVAKMRCFSPPRPQPEHRFDCPI